VWSFVETGGRDFGAWFNVLLVAAFSALFHMRSNSPAGDGTSCAVTFGRAIFRGRESGKLLALGADHLAHVTPPR
jgi:hypothetical protein